MNTAKKQCAGMSTSAMEYGCQLPAQHIESGKKYFQRTGKEQPSEQSATKHKQSLKTIVCEKWDYMGENDDFPEEIEHCSIQ